MKANFLCKQHRQELINQPKCAEDTWLKLMNNGRGKAYQQDWNSAAIVFGNAFETAEILLSQTATDREVNRYVYTATEFAYALRNCGYPSDLQMLVAIAEQHLSQALYPAQVQLLLKPLTDVAFSPMEEVNHWMQKLYGNQEPMKQANRQTVH